MTYGFCPEDWSYRQELWIEGDQAATFFRVFCGSI